MLAVVIRGEPRQVLPHLGVRFSRVCLVNLVVGVLDVDDEVVDERCDRLQGFQRHVERGLEGDFPATGAEGVELTDELGAQQRLPAAETDPAARGHEVEVVNPQLLVEALRRELMHAGIRIQAAGIQTVTTP